MTNDKEIKITFVQTDKEINIDPIAFEIAEILKKEGVQNDVKKAKVQQIIEETSNGDN